MHRFFVGRTLSLRSWNLKSLDGFARPFPWLRIIIQWDWIGTISQPSRRQTVREDRDGHIGILQ